MSELIEVIQRITQNTIQAMRLMDMATGTVVSADPLSVRTDTNTQPLPAAALILTDAVREKTAGVQGGEGGSVIITEGLRDGDRVLMLRARKGNKYLILSRLT